jgi:phosphoribosylanthranilate isomerase
MNRRTWIKMCGMTRAEDALAAAEAGADAVGFVFADSPRKVEPSVARAIGRVLPPHVLRFGVFVDEAPATIGHIIEEAGLDRVQLHGFEEPMVREVAGTRMVKAFRVVDESVLEEIRSWSPDFFFLDTFSRRVAGGTGETFDWSIAKRAAALGRLVLAGGLEPGNVGRALREVRPFGVDVSSGVEDSPGRKNAEKMRAFVQAVRDADRLLSREEPAAG